MKKHHQILLKELEAFLEQTPENELQELFAQIEEMHLPEDEPATDYLNKRIIEKKSDFTPLCNYTINLKLNSTTTNFHTRSFAQAV